MKLTSFVMATTFASLSTLAVAGGEYSDKHGKYSDHKDEYSHKMHDDKSNKDVNRDAYTFQELDSNNSGEIEKTEVMEVNESRNWDGTEFDEIDTNSDGALSKSEWANATDESQS